MTELVPLEKRIPEHDREVLAELYDSPAWKVFKQWLLEDGRTQLGVSALFSTPDKLLFLQGQADALKQIHGTMRSIFKYQQKIEAGRKKSK